MKTTSRTVLRVLLNLYLLLIHALVLSRMKETYHRLQLGGTVEAHIHRHIRNRGWVTLAVQLQLRDGEGVAEEAGEMLEQQAVRIRTGGDHLVPRIQAGLSQRV